ncbi:MAG: DsrE family protein [Bosea sp. (in: a-proteobacteria)]
MHYRTWIVLGVVGLTGALGASQAWTLYRPPHLGTPSDIKAMVFQPYDEQKVVYHLTQRGGFRDGAYRAALTQISNHMATVSDGFIEVRVLLQGEGISLLTRARNNPELGREITLLRSRGVRFIVCQNTVITHDIDPQREFLGFRREDMVPYSLAEIAALTQKGYIYIKL